MEEAGQYLLEGAAMQCRTMADGTLRIMVDVPPGQAKRAFEAFGSPGSPVVLGKLVVPAPVAETKPAATPKAAAQRVRMTPLCEWAVLRCAEAPFQQWAADVWESGELGLVVNPKDVVPETREEWAKYVLCHLCDVSSRKDLDTKPAAAQLFHQRVRQPYAAWLERQQVSA